MPVVTLTTDFGPGSPYVAAMKAVVLAGCPDAVLVDVSHTVAPFELVSASFVLWAGTRHFAPGTVHLAVVDPGVGGARHALAMDLGGSWYVGPDNGVFDLVVAEAEGRPVAVKLKRGPDTAPTFEGRDVFAPAAAALAAGQPLASLGEPLEGDPVRLPQRPPSVLWVDGFGNLVTGLKPPVAGLKINGHELRQAVRTYSDAPWDTPFLYVGSMGFVEVGVREARADQWLGAGVGTLVEPL